MKKFLENAAEYVLALLFIVGGINVLLFSNPIILPPDVFYQFLVGQLAIYVYGALFTITGLALLIAKWLGKDRVHTDVIMIMYLICVYVFTLSLVIYGLTGDLISTVLTGIVAAVLWLRRKRSESGPQHRYSRLRRGA